MMPDPKRIERTRGKLRLAANAAHWKHMLAELVRWAGQGTDGQALEAAKASEAKFDALIAFERAEAQPCQWPTLECRDGDARPCPRCTALDAIVQATLEDAG